MIANLLIADFDRKISKYFASSDWKDVYKNRIPQIDHDEPWITLIALYSLLGNLQAIDSNRIQAFNEVLKNSGIDKPIALTEITKVRVEEKLPEIIAYRDYLKETFTKQNFHLYPDRRTEIDIKKEKKTASFEGNTNLDLLIEGLSQGSKLVLFIEAKFLSDISYQIRYNPVRDQIIRNIDCGIDYVLNPDNNTNFENFYFMLLTPEVFKTDKYGGSKESLMRQFGPNSSRLYCYKMDDYKDFKNIKNILPHRKLPDNIWKVISNNIGWITFENLYKKSKIYKTIKDLKERKLIQEFFEARNLI